MEEPQKKPLIPFAPVPVRARRDGWTAEKQIAFIEALAETGVVEEACRRVGMSRTSADELRRRPCGGSFRRAWEVAVDYALYHLEEAVRDRVRRGVPRPIFYKGEQVGEWRHFDERLTMFLLRTRRPGRYGKWTDQLPAPERGPDLSGDAAVELDRSLDDIESTAGIGLFSSALDDDRDDSPPAP